METTQESNQAQNQANHHFLWCKKDYVNTGRKIPKTSVENSPVLQAILIMAALSSGVLRP